MQERTDDSRTKTVIKYLSTLRTLLRTIDQRGIPSVANPNTESFWAVSPSLTSQYLKKFQPVKGSQPENHASIALNSFEPGQNGALKKSLSCFLRVPGAVRKSKIILDKAKEAAKPLYVSLIC
jgi:hypothetical protein